jgi:hypothetical protein
MPTWTFLDKNTASWTATAKTAYGDPLLLESGDRVLLEGGDRIILEQSVTSYIPTWDFTNKS